ncbi:MAG TPA: GntR family transcriptional regulator [Actinocrinis sp.]|jgi:GntR family transcriptional regulator
MEISPRSPVPKHRQLREILLNLIDTDLEPDAPIPSERELGERFGLSRMTVRQAINQLVAEGRLYRVRGRGTFVSQPKMDLQIRLASFTEDMTRRGMVPASRTLSFERTEATPVLARQLEINPGEPVVRLVRLRYADSIPMAVERTHLPEKRVPGLLSQGTPQSLYRLLADEYGLKLTWGEQVIEASHPDPEDAALLEIPISGVALLMSRRSYADDVLVEYATSSYRADRYQLWVPLERPAQPITNPRVQRPSTATPPRHASSLMEDHQ